MYAVTMSKQFRRRLPVTLLTAVAVAGIHSVQAQEHDVVWVWNSKCPKPIHVSLRVQLDGKTIYAASMPLCRWERQFENGKASFQFTPGRTVVWYGYLSDPGDGTKDPGDPTAAGTALTVDFWQAGGESDVIELGYAVAAGNQLHMNSIALLSPTETQTTEMAPGLILETRPEK